VPRGKTGLASICGWRFVGAFRQGAFNCQVAPLDATAFDMERGLRFKSDAKLVGNPLDIRSPVPPLGARLRPREPSCQREATDFILLSRRASYSGDGGAGWILPVVVDMSEKLR
jgi:hypothetical protein